MSGMAQPRHDEQQAQQAASAETGVSGGMFENPEPFVQGGKTSPQGISVEGPRELRQMTPADEAFSRIRTGNDPELPPTAHAGGKQRFPIFEENAPLPTGLDAALKELTRWFHPSTIR